MPAAQKTACTRIPLTGIEDLSNAVLGAGLDATQFSRGPLEGSLITVDEPDLTLTSGLLLGRVALKGPLSRERVTLGICLHVPPGSWHWHREVAPGTVGVFLPGDEHDALYGNNSLYAAVTLSAEQLEREFELAGLVPDRASLSATGLLTRPLEAGRSAAIAAEFHRAHGRADCPFDSHHLMRVALGSVLQHLARSPGHYPAANSRAVTSRIVRRATEFIEARLHGPIAVNDLALAAATSRRTLYRAFSQTFGETPQLYIRRRRLHRLRHLLIDNADRGIGELGGACGISQPGRFAARYRDLFGELPSATRRH